MDDEPFDLDSRRSYAAKLETEKRRQILQELEQQAALSSPESLPPRPDASVPDLSAPVSFVPVALASVSCASVSLASGVSEPVTLEKLLLETGEDKVAPLSNPMAFWMETAMRARYLLHQYAKTVEGRIPAQGLLIDQTLDDLAVLMDLAEDMKL